MKNSCLACIHCDSPNAVQLVCDRSSENATKLVEHSDICDFFERSIYADLIFTFEDLEEAA